MLALKSLAFASLFLSVAGFAQDSLPEPVSSPNRHGNATLGAATQTVSQTQGDSAKQTQQTAQDWGARLHAYQFSLGDGTYSSGNLDAAALFNNGRGFTARGELGGGISTSAHGLGFLGGVLLNGQAEQLPRGILTGGGGLFLETGLSLGVGKTAAALTAVGGGDVSASDTMSATARVGGRFRLFINKDFYADAMLAKIWRVTALSLGDMSGKTSDEMSTYQQYMNNAAADADKGDYTGAARNVSNAQGYYNSTGGLDPSKFVDVMDGTYGRLSAGYRVIPHLAIEAYGQVDTSPMAYKDVSGNLAERPNLDARMMISVGGSIQ